MINTQPISGTRDFNPIDCKIQQYILTKFKNVAESFGFNQYDTPILERMSLYSRKSGDEIEQQMYSFTDKDGEHLALRPEMTPSLCRLILKKMQAGGDIREVLPLKWYSLPQCWRFETPQRGRKREHYQLNCDIVGDDSQNSEIELILLLISLFQSFGLTSKDVGIKINSRSILQKSLKAIHVPDRLFNAVCIVIDKFDKIGVCGISAELRSLDLGSDTIDSILSTIDNKIDIPNELVEMFSHFEKLGLSDWVTYDPSIIRGLAYYTGIVFEAFDRKGELRAICGGGRYNKLLTTYGAKKDIPMVGFGCGDCVLLELLTERGLLPETDTLDFVVVAYNDMLIEATTISKILRNANAKVDQYLGTIKKVGKAFSYADKMNAKYVVFVAPDEWSKGMVRIKKMHKNGSDVDKEIDCPITNLVEWKTILSN